MAAGSGERPVRTPAVLPRGGRPGEPCLGSRCPFLPSALRIAGSSVNCLCRGMGFAQRKLVTFVSALNFWPSRHSSPGAGRSEGSPRIGVHAAFSCTRSCRCVPGALLPLDGAETRRQGRAETRGCRGVATASVSPGRGGHAARSPRLFLGPHPRVHPEANVPCPAAGADDGHTDTRGHTDTDRHITVSVHIRCIVVCTLYLHT